MNILESFCNDIFERLAAEAGKLASYNKKITLSSREIQTGEVGRGLLCLSRRLTLLVFSYSPDPSWRTRQARHF